MKTVNIIGALLLIIGFASVQVMAQETFKLNYKLEKGKAYYYRTTAKGEGTQNRNGEESTTIQELKVKNKYLLSDLSNDKMVITVSADSFYSRSIRSTGDENIFDGANLIGKKSQLVYNIYGKTLQNKAIDAIEYHSNIDLKRGIDVIFQIPEKAIKTGDIWTGSASDTNYVMGNGRIVVKSDITYKLEGSETINGIKCLKISYQCDFKYNGTSSTQGADLDIDGSGKSNGLIYFDTERGLVISTEYTTIHNGTVSVPMVDMVIALSGNTKTSTVLLDK